MQATSYPVTHAYQSNSHNCSQTALLILLSYYGQSITAEEIMNDIPVCTGENGEPLGTLNQSLATWCIDQGYHTAMYTFDCQVIDLSWQSLAKDKLLERLEAAQIGRNVPALGEQWSKLYLQSYADFLKAGGELHIKPYVTTNLLYTLLKDGPILLSVCFNTLYGSGRSRGTGVRETVADDVNGNIFNHSIVIYGVSEAGYFEIADPWQEPGRHIIGPERMLCAITAAQIECDNFLF